MLLKVWLSSAQVANLTIFWTAITDVFKKNQDVSIKEADVFHALLLSNHLNQTNVLLMDVLNILWMAVLPVMLLSNSKETLVLFHTVKFMETTAALNVHQDIIFHHKESAWRLTLNVPLILEIDARNVPMDTNSMPKDSVSDKLKIALLFHMNNVNNVWLDSKLSMAFVFWLISSARSSLNKEMDVNNVTLVITLNQVSVNLTMSHVLTTKNQASPSCVRLVLQATFFPRMVKNVSKKLQDVFTIHMESAPHAELLSFSTETHAQFMDATDTQAQDVTNVLLLCNWAVINVWSNSVINMTNNNLFAPNVNQDINLFKDNVSDKILNVLNTISKVFVSHVLRIILHSKESASRRISTVRLIPKMEVVLNAKIITMFPLMVFVFPKSQAAFIKQENVTCATTHSNSMLFHKNAELKDVWKPIWKAALNVEIHSNWLHWAFVRSPTVWLWKTMLVPDAPLVTISNKDLNVLRMIPSVFCTMMMEIANSATKDTFSWAQVNVRLLKITVSLKNLDIVWLARQDTSLMLSSNVKKLTKTVKLTAMEFVPNVKINSSSMRIFASLTLQVVLPIKEKTA